MRRRSRLGSPEYIHTLRAKTAQRSMKEGLSLAEKRLAARQCTSAYMNLVQAWQGYGQVMAENKGGGSEWIPHSDFMDTSGKFVDMCIRDLEHGLGRRTRRSRR
jgi:hypothetical protein